MKNIGKISVMMLAALALAGCSQKKQSKSSNGDGLKITQVKKGHLSDKNLSPKETVAVITAYTGQKYDEKWGSTLDKAKKNGLTVKLLNQVDYMSEGSGVSYMVSDDNGYTLKQVGKKTTYYIYSNEKKLTSVSMKDMVDYLNKHNSDSLVKSLAKKAKIDDEMDGGNSENNSTKTNPNIPGDAGLFDIPSAMQGTWYGYDKYDHKIKKLIITQNSITDSGSKLELHKLSKTARWSTEENLKLAKKYAHSTEHIGRTTMTKVRQINWINIMGWFQDAGDGSFYGLHSEKGQPVIVTAHGGGLWADTVYWKTPQLADQYKNKKFSDIVYDDGE